MIALTLDELRTRAEKDLRHPREGILLDWSYLIADATGAVAGAREWMCFNEHRYRDLKGTVTGQWAPDAESERSKELYRQLVELEGALATARTELSYATTVLKACELTLELLKRRKLPKAAVLPLRRVA